MATADIDSSVGEKHDFRDVDVAGIDQEVARSVYARLEQARVDTEFRNGNTFFFPMKDIDQEGDGEGGSVTEPHFGIEVSNADPLGEDIPSSSLQLLLIKAGDGSFRVVHHHNAAAEPLLTAEGVNALLRSLLRAEEVVSKEDAEEEAPDDAVVDDAVRGTREDLV